MAGLDVLFRLPGMRTIWSKTYTPGEVPGLACVWVQGTETFRLYQLVSNYTSVLMPFSM
jgi:hypothetical protein